MDQGSAERRKKWSYFWVLLLWDILLKCSIKPPSKEWTIPDGFLRSSLHITAIWCKSNVAGGWSYYCRARHPCYVGLRPAFIRFSIDRSWLASEIDEVLPVPRPYDCATMWLRNCDGSPACRNLQNKYSLKFLQRVLVPWFQVPTVNMIIRLDITSSTIARYIPVATRSPPKGEAYMPALIFWRNLSTLLAPALVDLHDKDVFL